MELTQLFKDDADVRQPKVVLLLLREQKLLTSEDLFCSYPKLFETPPNDNKFKCLSTNMRRAGATMELQVDQRTDEDSEPGATQAPQLRRILCRANQQHQAFLTFDKATARQKEEKRQAKEEQANHSKTSEEDTQLDLAEVARPPLQHGQL